MSKQTSTPLPAAEPSRRKFLKTSAIVSASALLPQTAFAAFSPNQLEPALEEFNYDQIEIREPRAVAQRQNVTDVLLGLDEDSLLKPFREMAGQPGPGASLGGWYEWKPDYNLYHDDAGLAPAGTFGQWVSALSRLSAGSKFGDVNGRPELAARALRLNELLGKTIAPGYFAQTRFPGYSFDKLVCGLIDARQWAGDSNAFTTLTAVSVAAKPYLPGHAIDRELQSKMGADASWMWDETYTLPENLYLAAARGAGSSYRSMARAYLDNESYFEPLARGVNVLSDKHAYSYVNALCSAMQAYLLDGSAMHLQAAQAGFAMLEAQSFATGGWGPDELLRKPGYDQVAKSLTASHNSFETPCGSYAHMKLTRYLLRATRDGRYGDSMERVMLNTVMGALPLEPDGRTFYYADYNVIGKRVYSVHRWPCCSGTLPQVVADYGINTYLHESHAIWVNLYHASELRTHVNAVSVSLEQTGTYLDDGKVRLRITTAAPVPFALRLRVPHWAQDATKLQVNARPVPVVIQKGFTTIDRVWHAGDLVEVEFPLALRLEALPPDSGVEHQQTVAVMRGPLVLFALREPGETGALSMDPTALLQAERTGPNEWQAKGFSGMRRLVPFTEVGDREYSTYVSIT